MNEQAQMKEKEKEKEFSALGQKEQELKKKAEAEKAESAPAQEVIAKGIQQLLETIEEEHKKTEGTTEVVLDSSNKVSFPGFPYKFTALGEKILVSIDVFKSGYECKDCKGTGRIKSQCSCETEGHPGKKYSTEAISRISDVLGAEVAANRSELSCPSCQGDFQTHRVDAVCPSCAGKGALLVMPETSKNLPTTGVVVSMGEKAQKNCAEFKVGDRVLFSPHAGTMIPTKAGLMFKYMDYYQASVRIEGGDDLAAFDFVIVED